MKSFINFSLILLIAALIISCSDDSNIVGNTSYISKTYNLDQFENVKNPFPGTVKLKKGAHKIIVNAESNIIDLIDIQVENNTLNLGSKDSGFESHGINFELFSMNYSILENNGSANWESDSLEFNPTIISNGSGNISLKGISDTQVITSNGTGKIDLLSMPTQFVNVKSNGSGEVLLTVFQDAEVLIEGSGNVTIKEITGTINVEINGSGNLYYSGSPENIIKTLNGSGNVIQIP